MRVFFRLDVSPDIGLGHLRRCITLSDSLIELGVRPAFLIRSTSRRLLENQFSEGQEIIEVPWDFSEEEDVSFLIKWCRENNVNCGVIDHYNQSFSGQRQLIGAGIKWLQFANPILKQPLGGDLLHDATPGHSKESYDSKRFIRPGFKFLSGPAYSLISKDLVRFRDEASLWPQRTRTLITFGGGNDRGAILAILDLLDTVAWPGEKVVLTTSLNPSLKKLEKKATDNPEIDLVVDNWSPGQLMAESRVAFCAGGTTLFELATLGVPVVITTIAKNQEAQAAHWETEGFGISLGALGSWDKSRVGAKLKRLIEDPALLRQMSEKSYQMVDGQGAMRTAREILKIAEE